MNVLLVSATTLEIVPFLHKLKSRPEQTFSTVTTSRHTVDILNTGVGIAHTSFYLGKYLNDKYDLALNAGVCGAFDRSLALGDIVHVSEDYFADLGAEDDEKFLSVSELNLPAAYYVKNENQFPLRIRQVRGVTVNTTHGNTQSIAKFSARIKADVESMEGAAFLWACNRQKVKCAQIRAVSNYVEKRDRSKWKIHEAIDSLNDFLIELLA